AQALASRSRMRTIRRRQNAKEDTETRTGRARLDHRASGDGADRPDRAPLGLARGVGVARAAPHFPGAAKRMQRRFTERAEPASRGVARERAYRAAGGGLRADRARPRVAGAAAAAHALGGQMGEGRFRLTPDGASGTTAARIWWQTRQRQ